MSIKNFDPKTPANLLSTQLWFAGVITQPIDNDSQMNPLAPSGRLISEEAKEFIAPSLKLNPDKRIQIYNQQYWWRLLTILHENFPLLTRLFGYNDFNHSIGMPFLTKYPSQHWSLSLLGDQLSTWIEKYYNANDKTLILHAAEVDWAYQTIFFAPRSNLFQPSLDFISKKLALEDHVKIFKLPFDLFSLRKALLNQEVDYWTEADFPVLSKERTYYFILYRTSKYQIIYQEIKEENWMLLDDISKGLTIEEACDNLEKIGGKAAEEAESSLEQWIQEWISKNWITIRDHHD